MSDTVNLSRGPDLEDRLVQAVVGGASTWRRSSLNITCIFVLLTLFLKHQTYHYVCFGIKSSAIGRVAFSRALNCIWIEFHFNCCM